MRGRDDTEPAIARLATHQHGVITRAQLRAAGLGEKAIDHRIRSGRLARIHPAVYALGHAALRREGWWMAAALAYGPGAVLSHHTAAAAWGLRAPRTRIDVTLETTDGVRSKPGTSVHRVRALPSWQTAQRGPLPVTSLARTLLDLAPLLDDHQLEQAIHEADLRGRFDLVAVRRVIAAHPTRAGAPRLASVLDRLAGVGAQRTRSTLEVRFRRLCADHGLPAPAVNAVVEGFEVDAWWPRVGVAVEVDGPHHRMPEQRRRDHEKRLALEALGVRVVVVTEDQVDHDGARTAGRLSAIIVAAAGSASHDPPMRRVR
jgi:hypothetical protein